MNHSKGFLMELAKFVQNKYPNGSQRRTGHNIRQH